MKKIRTTGVIVIFSIILVACNTVRNPDNSMPFGGPDDVKFATSLWHKMQQAQLVGKGAKTVEPIIGAAPPHGWVLEILDQKLTMDDHSGFLIVKRNYNHPDPKMKKQLTIDEVKQDRSRYLSSITIMYQREKGYDPDNRDWFWAKYKPDGQLFAKSKMGMTLPLAGRIMKGKTPDENAGCLYCHRSAGGGDYIFYPNIKADLHP